jgi:hypothetical protein
MHEVNGMMMGMSKTVVGFVALFGAVACSDSVTPSPTERLLGSWSWVASTGGIAGQTRTPATAGESMTLVFRGESQVELLRDGTLSAATTFRLGPDEGGEMSMIHYEEPIFGFASQEISLDEDRLTLRDGCCDGWVYEFERAR